MSPDQPDHADHADGPHHADGPTSDASAAPEVSDDERRAIEEERKRRLHADNRPDGAEVDNTHATLPTVEEFDRLAAQEGEVAGTADPAAKFREMEVGEEEQRVIAEERERRLDPANRPDNVEVDNTGRTFEDGRFVD